MPSPLRRRIALAWPGALLLGAAGCGGGGSDSVTSAPAPAPAPSPAPAPAPAADAPIGNVAIASLVSTRVGTTYNLDIHLPPGYDAETRRYPTIYALDGDAAFIDAKTRFTTFAQILERRGTKAILVGIGRSDRRQTDYNFPGAFSYHDFLVQELIPFIEGRWRADPAMRMITGLSTSGNLALSALFLEGTGPLVFTHYLSIEAAYWQQLDQLQAMELQMFQALAGRPLPATVIIAGGRASNQTNSAIDDAFYQRMAARNYKGLQLVERFFQTGHADTDIPAFEDALTLVFG